MEHVFQSFVRMTGLGLLSNLNNNGTDEADQPEKYTLEASDWLNMTEIKWLIEMEKGLKCDENFFQQEVSSC